MVYIPVKYKIKDETHANIKNLIKMTRDNPSWRKRLKVAPKLKKWDYDQSTGVLTRSALRYLLFNNNKPKDH